MIASNPCGSVGPFSRKLVVMRAVILACLLATPVLAQAESRGPKTFPRTGVWKNTVKNKGVTSAFTTVSHVLYLNDCRPNGCIVNPGADDSRTNTSSIPQQQVQLSAFSYSYWDQLVQCVKDTFAPFQIEVTTVNPGNANHFEVMVGGRATQLSADLEGAGGVAPFIDCSTTQDNVISFVFAAEVNDLEFLCGAVAQEAGHVWGMDHELDPNDPMTYLDLGSSKRFQNSNAQCGEDTPRACFCGGATQNSFQFMSTTFDDSNLAAPIATITSPTEGAFVRPGFTVRAELDSPLDLQTGQVALDGVAGQTAVPGLPLAFGTNTMVTAGEHTVTVSLTDIGNRTATDSVKVQVLGSCAAGCAAGFSCLGGLCLPGPSVQGGLGAACTENAECITETCASDGTSSQCTGVCDPGNVCPAGYECLANGGPGICWPESSAGGCSTSGNPASLLMVGLGFAVVCLRRRRRG